jgi:hypothetical protein
VLTCGDIAISPLTGRSHSEPDNAKSAWDHAKGVDGVTKTRWSSGRGRRPVWRPTSPAADGSGDHQTGVDPDADPQRIAESLGDEAVYEHRFAHRGVGTGSNESSSSAQGLYFPRCHDPPADLAMQK